MDEAEMLFVNEMKSHLETYAKARDLADRGDQRSAISQTAAGDYDWWGQHLWYGHVVDLTPEVQPPGAETVIANSWGDAFPEYQRKQRERGIG